MVDPAASTEMTREQKHLVQANIPLARFLAKVTWDRNRNEIELEEVTAVSYQGLISAAMRWDPTDRQINPEDILSGRAFSGYARQRIIGTILDWQRNLDHVQRSYRTLYKMLKAAGHQKGATIEELAADLRITVEKVLSVIQAVENPPLSLELTKLNREEGTEYDSFEIAATHNVEESAQAEIIKSAAVAMLKELPIQHQTVIVLRYYAGEDLQFIAAELGLSMHAVREIHIEAIMKIHAAMKNKAG